MVWHARHAQCFFQWSRLMVAAIQHREFVPARLGQLLLMHDIRRDALGFVFVIATHQHADRRSLAVLAPQFLFVYMWIVADQRVRRAQHARAAAVVLLELDYLQFRIVARELVEIARVCAAPGIDRLVVVAHGGERTARSGEMLEQAVLRVVGVLVFVDQQIAQALLPGAANFFVALEQCQRQANQVVEVDRIERRQPFLIRRVDFCRLQLARTARGGLRLVRVEAGVFRTRNQLTQGEQLIRLDRRRCQILHDRRTIVCIEHREPALEAELGVFDLQESKPKRMERAHDDLLCGIAFHQAPDTLAHLARRLVGERDGRDLVRRHLFARDQVRDLLGDHARLARTRAGEHEQWTVVVFDGGALRRIKHEEPGLEIRDSAERCSRTLQCYRRSRDASILLRTPTLESPIPALEWPSSTSITRR